jgi:uncharacterized membrane protein YcaP (DUF421 family)
VESEALKLGVSAAELVIRCVVIYLALLLGMRLFGKREIGQFTLFDLVFVLLVANAVQPAMTGPDNSITGGVIIIATLILLNFVISYLRVRFDFFARLVSPAPVVLARNGKLDKREMRRQGITDEEMDQALREHELENIGDTRLVIIEEDGSISVIPKDRDGDGAAHRHRRRRFARRG